MKRDEVIRLIISNEQVLLNRTNFIYCDVNVSCWKLVTALELELDELCKVQTRNRKFAKNTFAGYDKFIAVIDSLLYIKPSR